MPFVKNELCVGCGVCVEECPLEAIHMEDGIAVVDQVKCTKCGKCINVCPAQAIRPNSESDQLKGGGAGRKMMRGYGGDGLGGGRCSL